MSHKLSCHKTVVGDYNFIFLKQLGTVITNHGFNFKFKVSIGDYSFHFIYISLIFLNKNIILFSNFKSTYLII